MMPLVQTTTSTWARAAAWLMAAATIALLVTALLIQARSPAGVGSPQEILTLLSPLMSVLVGAVVVDRKAGHAVGWLFCLSGLGWALHLVGYAAGRAALSGQILPAGDFLVWLATWCAFAAFGFAPVLVIYVFPTGRLASARWLVPFRLCVATIAVASVAYAFAPRPIEDLPALTNPYAIGSAIGGPLAFIVELAWPLYIVAVAGGVVSLRRRSKLGSFEERQQIKWLLLAGVFLLAFSIFWGVTESLGHAEVPEALAGVFLPLLPIALGIAILRHRLYDIDVLINRTLVYASLSAVLAAVYLGAIVVFGWLLAPITADSNLATAGSTLAVAGLVRPLRAAIQAFINRRFYRQKYDAAATLGRFSHRLRDEIDLDALAGELLGAVGQTVQPRDVRLWLTAAESAS